MEKKLSNEEIKRIILDLENRYPVDSWKIDGIEVWPYIRNKLYIFLLNYGVENKNIIENKIPKSKELETSYFKKVIRFIPSYFKLLNFYASLKRKDILFFSVPIHRIKYKGRAFNRYFDPMIEKYNLAGEVYVMEYQHNISNVFHPEVVIPIKRFIDIFRLKERFKNKLKNKSAIIGNETSLANYEAFYNEVKKHFTLTDRIGISKEHLRSWSAKLRLTSKFFTRILKKIKPSKVIFQSYNSFDDFYAAIYSANELSIRTIDFQHGFQTNYHMIYNHWSKIPNKGYNIMPLEYWHWDQNSSSNVLKWTKVKAPFIKSHVVGHPYLSYWVEKNSKKKCDSNLIFYSLGVQNMDFLFPEKLLELIKESKMRWVIRMHPRSHIEIKEIKRLFENHQISFQNIIFQNAFDSPLPETLANSYVHITNFSGCVIEAKMMGIPTIIISEAGKNFFEKYIDNISVYFNSIDEPGFNKRYYNILTDISERRLVPSIGSIINPLEQ